MAGGADGCGASLLAFRRPSEARSDQCGVKVRTNDRGLGGKKGSLWTVNNLMCVWATDGYERPRGTFWELKEWPFFLSEAFVGERE